MQAKIELTEVNENIRVYPAVVGNVRDKVIAIGDLHGNTMKLIYVLQRYGIMHLSEESFRELWAIYDKPVHELMREDLVRFENLVNDAVIDIPGLLNCIGDEFADRGKNDFFTALVFKKLHDAHVPFRIQLSNHSTYLLNYLETGRCELLSLEKGQSASLDNLILLEKKFPELHDKFVSLTQHAYTNHLSLIGYAQPEGEPLCLFTHAPMDGVTLKQLARNLLIAYDDTSPEALIAMIDAINSTIVTQAQQGQLSRIFLSELYQLSWGTQNQQLYNKGASDPVCDVLWNRNRPREPLPCGCLNIHGHVGDYERKPAFNVRYVNLDSDWGKPAEDWIDPETNKRYIDAIPADDQKKALVFFEQLSPADKLSRYFGEAALPVPDLDMSMTTVESRSDFSPSPQMIEPKVPIHIEDVHLEEIAPAQDAAPNSSLWAKQALHEIKTQSPEATDKKPSLDAKRAKF